MDYLNNYKMFENKFPKGKLLEIRGICNIHHIHNYTINDDCSIDVKGTVDFSYYNLQRLPLKFNKVSGDFTCYNNRLTTLEGCPKYVGRDFVFSSNKITSLEYCPEYIGGECYCSSNPIYSIVQYFIYKKNRNNLIELFNYYDIVQDMNVIYDRLEYFFSEIHVELTNEILEEIEENYKIIR